MKENDEEIRGMETELAEFLSNLPGGIFRYRADEAEILDFVSDGLLDLYGYEEEAEFRQMVGNSFHGMIFAPDSAYVHMEIDRQIARGLTDQVSYRIVRKDGTVRWVEDRGHLVTDKEGMKWFYVVLLDITEKIHYQQQLERGDIRQRALADLSNDIFFDVDYENGIIDVFGDYEKRFGKQPEIADFAAMAKARGKDYSDYFDRMEIRCHEISRILETAEEIDLTLKDKDAMPVWCRYQSAELENNPLHRVGRLLDIHEFVLENERNIKKANHDGLTGLLNRNAAKAKIQHSLNQMEDGETGIFVLVDIDNFKHINDTYGHPKGDEVLVYLARKMESFFRAKDILARMGGDEFLIFLTGVKDCDWVETRIERFCREVFTGWEAAVPVKGELSCSMGGASTVERGISAEELYRMADAALYRAKAGGKGRLCMCVAK